MSYHHDHNEKINEQVLERASALALGALEAHEAEQICREIEGSSYDTVKEYQRMVWTTHHLPAVLPMVEPPARLKTEILKKIHIAETPKTKASQAHSEFVPEVHAERREFYTVFGSEGAWLQHPVKGITVKPLSTDKERGYATLLMNLEAGTVFPSHNHEGSEQCYVLSGAVNVRGTTLRAGDFFSTQAHADHGDIIAPEGATVLLVVALEDYRKSALQVGWTLAKERVKRIFA
ncbi:MAG: cupin domain-containing protein [Candidatus Kapabacteria bacterium]|jgi:quercetin dioxygenase-like cupin family protein|nr:cupin domain-containing protein [Candidatus Kapabacteria bacterium]